MSKANACMSKLRFYLAKRDMGTSLQWSDHAKKTYPRSAEETHMT